MISLKRLHKATKISKQIIWPKVVFQEKVIKFHKNTFKNNYNKRIKLNPNHKFFKETLPLEYIVIHKKTSNKINY